MLAALASREISCSELMDLHLARIAERNPELNAIVSLDEDRARDGASEADRTPYDERGPLHGLPWAFKDTHDVAGWLTTYGSPLLADNVPDRDELIVERIRRAGAVPIGKTNVPEFAAGSHTFNTGLRYHPQPGRPDAQRGRVERGSGVRARGRDGAARRGVRHGWVACATRRRSAGSSGLRPSRGRVPAWPSDNQWEALGISGPMARNVDDLALLLSVVAGPDPRVPLALGDPGATFAPPVTGSLLGLRVAVSTDLGGLIEVDAEVAAVVEASAATMAAAGARVEAAHPDLALGEDTFRTLRAWSFQAGFRDMLEEHPEGFKPSLADNIRAGEGLSGADVARAYRQLTALAETARLFFESYDVLLLPTSQVPPFPADQEYPADINGQPMATYLDWMRSAYLITVTGCPAVSVPAGRTRDGLPVGVQLVASHGADRRLLEVAAAVEALGPA